MQSLLAKDEFFRVLFEAIPANVLILDAAGIVQSINKAAEQLLGMKSEEAQCKQGGELFHCLFAQTNSQGCGHTPRCKNCVVRSTAMAAIAGETITRAKGKLIIQLNQEVKTLNLLVSSAPLHYEQQTYAIVIVEDISIISELEGLLPICCACKKIRDDQGYWKQVERYVQEHSEAEFTHGYCPDCLARLYPQYDLGGKDD